MESDRENSPTDDNLRTDESRREIFLGFSAGNAAAAQVASAKDIPCNECATSFSSLQKYMEHHCPNARLPLLKDENESEISDLEDSDVENLTGELVYQPDGSAFIFEDSKESGQNAQPGANSLYSPAMFSNTHITAGEKTEQSAAAPMSFYPQVINTFHIASSLGKSFTADQAFPNTSAFAGVSPVLHSFRVYDLRHKSDKDYLTIDGAAKNSFVSKDVPNNVDLSKFDGCVSDGKRKPILMCFLCKLSFGYIRSFVTHAVHDHRMTLNEEEQKLLSNKYVSAIIQGIGKDKEPLISFLEPKKNNSVLPHFSTANFIDPDSSFRGLWNAFHVENGDSLQAGFAFLKGSASSAASAEQPLSKIQMPKAEMNLGGLSVSATNTPFTSVSLSHSSSVLGSRDQENNCERQKEVSILHSNSEFPIKSEPTEPVDTDEDEDAYSTELNDDGAGELADSTSSKDFPLLNQSISPLSSSVLKYTEKGTSSSVSVSDDLDKTKQTTANRDSSNDTNNYSISGKDFTDTGVSKDSATTSHPNDTMRGDDESPATPHQHIMTTDIPGTGEGSPGSGVECPKCDTVLGSSRSLGGHMTMMHSRNSCKTLKCPKCNWHYKYQQTLEAHMKEKHPESTDTCVYCKTVQAHPRLSRGESYTCGYKPFRCEVCNYSTTTKGNLSIHMQSDKHLNNVQTLQNGGIEQVFNHTVPVPTSSLSGCGTPSPSKPKQKPTWRCEVCDYETNVARNLRIHMTSEKHMHNMMLLQQNMKQIQHNLHLGLAPAEAELYQYYLAQNIGLTGMKLENPADPQMMISPFQLDPSTAVALTPGLVNNELPPEIRLASGQLMGDDLSVLSAGELSPYISDPLVKLFQCAVCNKFTSDSLEALSVHVNTERSLPEEEWRAVIGDIYQCKLCNYNTQLKANFQLHCKTDKHMQKYQLVAHIKEGGKANEWRLKCIAIGNPVHLKCNACDYYTNSVDKLRLHTTNHRHEAALNLYKLLTGALSQMPSQTSSLSTPPGTGSGSLKRKLDEKEESSSNEKDGGNSGEDQHRDKRLRTTITPEQLEILYEKYLLDSNPTRKMLDHIAREVGLKKRVVQVLFQNTRARERKGQFRAVGPVHTHKRCPFCRALFKAKSALESHISSRHWHEAKQAGYSVPPSPLQTVEDGGGSPQKYSYFEYPSLPITKTESSDYELPTATSTPSKHVELPLNNFLSPSSLKAESSDDVEGINMHSADVYDQNKMDFDETSSINTAISDATTGDEGNNEVESITGCTIETKPAYSPAEPKAKTNPTPTSGICDEKLSYCLVNSLSFSGKDSDQYYSMQDDDLDDYADQSETSSLADPSSPSPFGANNPFKSSKYGGERLGNKRFRTQMSNLQLKLLKTCFSDYRTPTMQECEMLGNEIGLPKRVVQVWFQNARAKEKKFKINIGKPFMMSQDGPKTECSLCGIKYTARLSIRDHIFSRQHISKVQETVGNQIDREKDYLAPTTVRQLMAQQELDRLKKATDVLGLTAQQQTMIDSNALHGLSLPTAYPGLSALPPVLLPGVNGPSSLPGFPPNTPALASPGAGMLGFPTPATPSPAMSLSSAPSKPLLQTHPPAHMTSQQTEEQSKNMEKEKKVKEREESKRVKEREAERTKPETRDPNKKRGKASPALPTPGKVGSETTTDPAQIQALQNAIAGDPSSFIGGQFLPYFIPGFASCFTPQLPGGLQGGYFPPLCGMENLFPYSPAMPQAIAGLSPTALLQQYQQYQQSLQDSLQKQQQQQQKQLEQQQKKPTPVKSSNAQNDILKPKKASETKEDKGSSTESTKEKTQTDTKSTDFLDAYIVPSIKHEFICRKCQVTFADEESAVTHQKSFCYFGQPFIDPQDTVLRNQVSKYNCLACDVAISGNEALGQHLQSSLHKEKTIKQAMRNAKEHARLLPHSVCSPNPNTTSTSQSAASSNNTYPHLSRSSMKSWPNILFQASARKAASSPSSSSPPSLSLPSTVTSTSCSTSGVQTSLPTESCSDESDSELSQKLDDLDHSLEVKAKTASGLDGNFNSIRMDMFSV
ncbi:Zinc finger homeobox protein 4 [Acipenser ruthenus]|uniref:Zinc finger homeobox protein 4 n=1 Tax=Acipenser ruthenus TaxID=7906 RepID=A0A444U8B0_ACIRT|nr:Zinc finger homeobox protein 4 [Acipenser ruthenus]